MLKKWNSRILTNFRKLRHTLQNFTMQRTINGKWWGIGDRLWTVSGTIHDKRLLTCCPILPYWQLVDREAKFSRCFWHVYPTYRAIHAGEPADTGTLDLYGLEGQWQWQLRVQRGWRGTYRCAKNTLETGLSVHSVQYGQYKPQSSVYYPIYTTPDIDCRHGRHKCDGIKL